MPSVVHRLIVTAVGAGLCSSSFGGELGDQDEADDGLLSGVSLLERRTQVRWGAANMDLREASALAQEDSSQPTTSELPPPKQTYGGGFQGGLTGDGTGVGTITRQPAPPMQFPTGCHWKEPKRVAVVHVGKCAGTSMNQMLQRAPVNYTQVHVSYAHDYFEPADHDLFVVTSRDPVDRLISAFNWRHPVGGGLVNLSTAEHPVHFNRPEEKEMYDCFPELPGGVNAFAEALDSNTACGLAARRCLHSPSARCSHISFNFHYYLAMGLRNRARDVLGELRLSPSKRAFMVGTHTFSDDMSALWDWLCVPPDLRPPEVRTLDEFPRHSDTYVSTAGQKLLEKHLVRESFALQELAHYTDNGMRL